MSVKDILGGLKLSLERGISLKDAMMSFYNSGYKKEDVEEAAKVLLQSRQERQPIYQPQSQQPIQQPTQTSALSEQPQQLQPEQLEGYSEEQGESEPINKTTLIILIVILLILVGIFVTILIFRDAFMGLFS